MPCKKDRRPGPEKFERRIRTADLLTGASAASWLVPIILIFNPVRHDVFVFITVAAAASSMAMFLLGVVYRFQRGHQQRQMDAVNDIRETLLELRELVLDVQLYSQAQTVELANRVERIGARVERDRWNIYSEAAADMQGGEGVVDETATVRLDAASSVVRILPHRRNNGRIN